MVHFFSSVMFMLIFLFVIVGLFSSPLSFPCLTRESVKEMSGSSPNMTGKNKSTGMMEREKPGNTIHEKSRCKIAYSLYNHFCRRKRLDRRRSVETPYREPIITSPWRMTRNKPFCGRISVLFLRSFQLLRSLLRAVLF